MNKFCVQVCSDFLAGDALRSSNRYKALDETALFGCGRRHEFPLMFINLKHGERYYISTCSLISIHNTALCLGQNKLC